MLLDTFVNTALVNAVIIALLLVFFANFF